MVLDAILFFLALLCFAAATLNVNVNVNLVALGLLLALLVPARDVWASAFF